MTSMEIVYKEKCISKFAQAKRSFRNVVVSNPSSCNKISISMLKNARLQRKFKTRKLLHVYEFLCEEIGWFDFKTHSV